MAKWRAIHEKISRSGQVNRMSEFAQFLFERAMLHTDDWGVITGDPLEIKAAAMPLSQRSEEEFEAAVSEMGSVGLIWRYKPDGWGPLIQYINFDDYQPKVLIGNRSDPKLPIHHEHPNYEEYPDLHWKTLEEPVKGCKSEEKEELYSHSKSRSKSKSSKGSKRDSRLDHPAIKGYNELARLHVPIPLRDDWIKCADEIGVDYLLESVKLWIGNGWNKQNVNGIMDWSKQGRPGRAKDKRNQATDDLPYDQVAAERQAAREAAELDA